MLGEDGEEKKRASTSPVGIKRNRWMMDGWRVEEEEEREGGGGREGGGK